MVTQSQLKEYIARAKALEISCYQQNVLCSQLARTVQSLERERETILEGTKEDVKPDSIGHTIGMAIGSPILCAFWGVLICLGIGLVIGLLVSIVTFFRGLSNYNPIFVAVMAVKEFLFSNWLGIVGRWLFRGLVVGAVGGVVVGLLVAIFGRTSKREARRQNLAIASHNQEVAREAELCDQRVHMALRDLSIAREKYQETIRTRDKFYSVGVIFPKYRKLVPVSMFHEYLQSGRCGTLEGHEGAYNLFESECAMHLILSRLDDIVSRLDDIVDDQQALAQEIRASRSQAGQILDGISRSLQRLEESSAATRYYEEITAQNTSFLAWLAYFKN